MKIVTFYNHKGGVSKTTTTFNLACYLAGIGRKVLMVDADPQCNLTEIALVRTIAERDEKSTTANILDLPGTSILDALNQRISGDAAKINLSKVKTNEVAKNLYLLRGSVDLSSIEDDLAEAYIQRASMRTNLMRTYVAIGDFFERLAQKENYDYIFVDVGPSSGALTRAFFLACDVFYIPAAPDRFNVQAIGTLSTIIDRWMTEHAQVKNQYADLGLPIRHGNPAFLGAVIQAFKLYAGRAKPGYELWMKRLPQEITASLKPVMKKHGSLDDMYLPGAAKPIAIQIPDFNQLAPLMQEVGKAVFDISKSDTAKITDSGDPWQGNNWLQAAERMKKYKLLFKKLADQLEKI